MPNSRGIRAGRAFVELFAEDSELNRALMRAAGRLKAFGRAVRNIGLSIGSAGAGILAPLIKGVETYARMSFELNRANQVTGISGKALSGLSYAAEKSGVDFMTLTLAIGRYQRNLVNAVNGDKMARQAFEETGVSIDALAKMSPEAQFYAMADAFAKMGDPATRAHAALVLFGRGATRLLPMLEGGSGAIRKLVGEAKEIGRVWSNSDIRMGAYLYQTWIELKGAATALFAAIGRNLAPAMQFLAQQVLPVLNAFTAWVRKNPVLTMGIMAVGGALAALGAALVGVGIAVQVLGVALAGIATIMTSVGAVVGAILSPIGLLVGSFGALIALLISSPAGITAVKGAIGFLGEKCKWLGDTAKIAFAGIADALRAGDFVLAGKIAFAGLELAWKEGQLKLKEAWIDFKAWMRAGAQWDFLEIGAIVLNAVCVGMIHAITGVAMAFAYLRRDALEAWAAIRHPGMGDEWAKAMGAADDQYRSTVERLKVSDQAAVAESDAWKDKKFQMAEEERVAAKIADEARLAAERAGLDPIRARIEALKAELGVLRNDASQSLEESRSWDWIAEHWKPELGADPLKAASRTLMSFGQFGAASLEGIRGIGREDVLKSIAENTERTAENTEDIKLEFSDR